MYQDDALLKHTRAAAHKIMTAVTAQPQATRAAVIRTALDTIRPGLFETVDRMAQKQVLRGVTSLAAYEEALRLALADEMVTSVRALGRAKLTGRLTDDAMRAQRIFYADNGPPGLGDTGDGLGASVGTSIAKFGESLLRNAACSPEVNAAIMGQVTNDSGRAATSAGLSVAAGISQCGRLPGQPPAPAPAPAAAPPPPPAPDKTMTYVLVGAAVLGVGAIAFLALRKKTPPTPVTPNRRGGRPWKDRLISAPKRPSHLMTVIAVPEFRPDRPHDGLVAFTAYGGPMAPQNPDDPDNKDPEGARAFWEEHALAVDERPMTTNRRRNSWP